MKKLTLGIAFALAITVALNNCNVNVKAETTSASTVFNPKEVVKLEKEIQKLPVYLDKDKVKGNKLVKVDKKLVQSRKSAKKPWNYPTRKGVILVTSDAYKGLIPTGHAAIVYSSSKVIESLSDGVKKGKNNWYSKHKTCYGVTTTKTSFAMDAYVADWCALQIGKKYNWNYFNVDTRKKFYCSQLVWAGYLDKEHINLNTKDFGRAVHPMELVKTGQTATIYTQE